METQDDKNIRTESAVNRIRSGPRPDWVLENSYDPHFKKGKDNRRTLLLHDKQVHAEQRASYYHCATRLETIEAVQQDSQWRIHFEPRNQSITLHHLKIHRGDSAIDHLNLENGRVLQREEGLNRLVIDGCLTCLIVLEDVRPGDILDFSYTVETSSDVFPKFSYAHFALPEWMSIGKYHFSFRFKPERSMKWKCVAGALAPVVTARDGLSVWTWAGEKYIGPKPEPNTPAWHTPSPWIQVSDCSDWQSMAGAIAEAWSTQADVASLSELVEDIEKQCTGLAERIDKAIEIIQDSYRYLSINVEFGGYIPARPEKVARRRYGDCKDLSFLLANLLKRLGVSARPILVNTRLRKAVRTMLPAPSLFNHAIVEFEAEGNRRWVDPTLKRQGGGAYNRIIHDYGFGLPVDASATTLAEAPQIPEQSHLLEVRETILLDTARNRSLISTVVRAEGWQAELLRGQFEANGTEEMKRQRQQQCANRFGLATQDCPLQFRDYRALNKFFLVEVYQIDKFLRTHTDPKMLLFNIPSQWVKQCLPVPALGDRQNPFALPHPCHLVHIIDIRSNAIRTQTGSKLDQDIDLKNRLVHFRRKSKSGFGYMELEFSLNTLADSVPPSDLKSYRAMVEEIGRRSPLTLTIPRGNARTQPGRGFYELPKPSATPIPIVPEPCPSMVQQPLFVLENAPPIPPAMEQSESSRRRKRSRSEKNVLLMSLGFSAIVVVIILIVWILTKQ